MRVEFINPPHFSMTGIHNNQNAGLGLLYLAAQLPEHDVKILDAEAAAMKWDDLEVELKSRNNDVIGVTATTLSFKAMIKTCKISKRLHPDCKIIIGGPHASAMPYHSLALTGADILIIGEGENSIKDAVNMSDIDISHEGNIIMNGTPLENLDVDLPREKYYPKIGSSSYVGNDPVHASPEAVVMWQRGCPHKCNFCTTHKIHGRVMRRRSTPSIIRELQELKDNGIKGVFVYDDEVCGVSEEQTTWLASVCEAIVENKLNDLEFKSQGRCSKKFLNPEIFGMMKEAGFKSLMMGCESGSQKVLDTIGKSLTIEDIKKTLHDMSKAGLEAFTYWMIGNKEETAADAQMTYDLIKELKKEMLFKWKHVTILNPLVGSEIYEEATREGWILDHNFNNWSQHGKVVMQGPWMNCQEILDWERKLLDA